jgi:hypothetical protein
MSLKTLYIISPHSLIQSYFVFRCFCKFWQQPHISHCHIPQTVSVGEEATFFNNLVCFLLFRLALFIIAKILNQYYFLVL